MQSGLKGRLKTIGRWTAAMIVWTIVAALTAIVASGLAALAGYHGGLAPFV